MIDFDKILEYELFKDLTTLDSLLSRVLIDINYETKYFKPEERKDVFLAAIKYYKEHNFFELQEEYKYLLSKKTYSNLNSVQAVENFNFNHPFVVLLHQFIEQNLLTNDLEINPELRIINLGERVMNYNELKGKNITEGIIFKDGYLLPIKSNSAHKIGTLWTFLNGRKVIKAVRYTSDCIHPDPIFCSMSEYVKMPQDTIKVTEEQAIAMYNIHQLKSNSSFEQVLSKCDNLCITPTGDSAIRYDNAKTFQNALGKEIFDAKEIVSNLRSESFLY
jgi:hypothetical protein